MAELFVNYRKIDTRMSAAFVYDFLIGRFGAGHVFIDHISMQPGDLYPPALRSALERAEALIVLIGPDWLAEDPARPGRRLVDREDDWVRNEIRRALERGIEIIPVLVDGASLPSFGTLPADINDVLKRQYATIRHRTAGTDLVKLADFVADKVPALVLPGLFDEEPPLPEDPLPSELLRSGHQIVGFRRFGDHLDRLESWLDEDADVRLRLVTGPGGAGKTRLAVELVAGARRDGWQAGFVGEDAEPEAIERLGAIKERLLLVVDYVEGRSSQIEALVRAVRARPAGLGAVRVLLLARADGLWRRMLARHRDLRIADLFRDLTVDRIVAIEAGTSRRSLFQEAARRFGEELGAEVEAEPPAELDDDRYDRVLDVLAAALSAVLDGLAPGPMPVRSDPVRRVLDHEERHWRRSAPAYGLTDRTEILGEVVAAATLVGADDRVAARRVLESMRRVADGGAGTATDFLVWLDRLYPGRAVLNPLRPDRLGEDLIASVLEIDHPELATELAAVVDDQQVVRALTVLSRAAARHPVVRKAMADLLVVEPTQRIVLAMSVATQVDDATLVEVLAEAGVAEDLTPVIVDNLPDHTLSLAALAVVHTKALLRAESRRVPVDTWAVAELRQNLAVRLIAVGELDQALIAAAEAVDEYRTLDEPRELAGALSTLANVHRHLGFRADGVEHAVEAVNLLEGLETDDEDVATDLLHALVSLADAQHEAGDVDGAAESIADAVVIARRQAENATEEPLRRIRLATLASALATVSGVHDTRNEWEESFRVGEEVVRIFRELDAVEPDAYRADLIEALGNYAGTHAELNLWAEGAALGEEAVELARSLVARHGEAHTTRLADTLNNTAALLRRLGEHRRALEHLGQAVALYRGLANRLPGVHLVNLAGALHNLGNCFDDAKRPQEAVDAYEESIEIYRKLRGPGDDEIDSDLAEAIVGLSHVRTALDDTEVAHDLAVEAVELLENAMRVDRVRTRRRLAHALYRAAATALDLGEYELAVRDAGRAADLYPRVVRENGNDFTSEHAGVLHLLGRSLDEVGEHDRAWPVLVDALRLQRSVVAEAERGDEERKELAHILLNAAVCAGALGHHQDAVTFLHEAVALWRAFGADDPLVRPELAEALNNLADTYCDVEDIAPAVIAADEALELAEAGFHPDDPASRSLLVYVLATRGRAAGGDVKEAVGFLRRAWKTAAKDNSLKAVVLSTCEQMGVPERQVRGRGR